MAKERRKSGQKKLSKAKCEICNYSKSERAINYHHIIPEADPRCTNDNSNLAVLCHCCHDQVHAGEITIIGVYKTTLGRKLMFFFAGEEPPLEKEFWLIKENPFVITNQSQMKQEPSSGY